MKNSLNLVKQPKLHAAILLKAGLGWVIFATKLKCALTSSYHWLKQS